MKKTLELTVERAWKKPTYTIDRFYIDGAFLCNMIEDRDRGLTQSMSLAEIKSKKVYGETAIPSGRYEVKMTYSPKFKRVLPLICNVPGFDGIRIHRGNTAADSLGCLLPGENKAVGKVINSTKYEKEIVERLTTATEVGMSIFITIK